MKRRLKTVWPVSGGKPVPLTVVWDDGKPKSRRDANTGITHANTLLMRDKRFRQMLDAPVGRKPKPRRGGKGKR